MSPKIRHFLHMSGRLVSGLLVGTGVALFRVFKPRRRNRRQTRLYVPCVPSQITHVGGRVQHAMGVEMVDMKEAGQELQNNQTLNKKEIVFGHITFLR